MPPGSGGPRQAGAGRGLDGVSAGTSTAAPLAGRADEATAAADCQQPLAVPAGLRLARKVETALIIWSLLIQARFYTHTEKQLTAAQHAQQLVLLGVRMFCLLISLTIPTRAWLRHRGWLIFVTRIWLARLSKFGSQEGHAVLLQRPAAPGWLGCILDVLRVGNGIRLVPSALTAGLLHLPPLSVALQQFLTLVQLAPPRGFCAAPLLEDPLTQKRTAVAWSVLELTPFTLPGPSTEADVPAAHQPGLQCMAVLLWAQLMIGVVLPVLVAGCTASSTRLPAPQPRQGAPQGENGVLAAAATALRQVGSAVSGSLGWIDGLLEEAACILASDPFYLTSGLWVLGGLCWLLAKAQALAALSEPAS